MYGFHIILLKDVHDIGLGIHTGTNLSLNILTNWQYQLMVFWFIQIAYDLPNIVSIIQ